jgi:large subunit ribosomal protein L21
MTYAILQHGGRQYRVSAGDRLLVDRLPADVGSMVALEPVLLVGDDGGKVDVGTPAVDGVRVAALVVSHRRGKKLRIFKYKAKKRYRKTMGFRADLTELRVDSVLSKGDAVPKAPVVEKAKPKAKAKAKAKATVTAPAKPEAKAKAAEPKTAKAKAETAPTTEAKTPAKAAETKKPAKAEKAEAAEKDSTDGA